MSKNFHALKVKNITEETTDTVTVSFDIPDNLEKDFKYKQGQYLTLRFDINGEDVRRAYSMSSSPVDGDIAVTIKRVNRGKVSNFIHDKVKTGDTIDVMQPDGRFFTELNEDACKTYYLFGAGSGITPLMSILKTILEFEPKSTVNLLYGNRNENSIIFKNTLDNLEKKYAGQLKCEHILSQPIKEKKGGLKGLFSKGKVNWTGKVGRINANVVGEFLEENPDRNKGAEYFICGPGTMIDAVKDFLNAKGVDKKNIHFEAFVNAAEAAAAKANSKGGVNGAKMTVQLDGNEIVIDVPKGKNLLDTLLDAGYDAPYSCTAGACATCMAKVTKGKAKMDQCFALDDDEIENGYVLTCQAHPDTAEIEMTFDV